MKRVLSLVLALVLVLGMIPTFAADMTGGQNLFANEFIAGDGMGNLMEDQLLTREQLAKLILELNGSKEEAEALTLPPSFTDSAKISAWARPYVAYAQIEGLMVGFTDGSFRPMEGVTGQQLAAVLTRALGYEFEWATVLADAADLGIEVAAEAKLTRGQAFDAMWTTVNTNPKDGELPLGVVLGKLPDPTPVVVELAPKAVTVVNTNQILVQYTRDLTTEEKVEALKIANYSIYNNGATTAMTDASFDTPAMSGTDSVLITSKLTALANNVAAHKVVVEKAAFNGAANVTFDALSVQDVERPFIKEVTVVGPSTIKVTMNEPVYANTTTPTRTLSAGSFQVDAGLVGVSGVSAAATPYTEYTLTLSGTLSEGAHTVRVNPTGVSAANTVFDGANWTTNQAAVTFNYAKDTTAPTATIYSATQTTVVLQFNKPVVNTTDANVVYYHSVKAANYVMTASYNASTDRLTLTAPANTPIPAGNAPIYVTYTSSTGTMIQDLYGNKMPATTITASVTEDVTKPEVASVAYNSTTGKIDVTFTEAVEASSITGAYSATNPANYVLKLGTTTVPVTGITYSSKVASLSATFVGGSYTLEVKNIKDTALVANKMDATSPYTVAVADGVKPYLVNKDGTTPAGGSEKIYTVDATGKSFRIYFSEPMNATDLADVTKYSNSTGVNPASATADADGKSVMITFTTAPTTGNDTFSVGQLRDLAGNRMVAFVTTLDSVTATGPVLVINTSGVTQAVATSTQTIDLFFDSIVYNVQAADFTVDHDGNGAFDKTPASISTRIVDGKTVVTLNLAQADALTVYDFSATNPQVKTVVTPVGADQYDNLISVTATNLVDNIAPALVASASNPIQVLDVDSNGKVDYIKLTFTENVLAASVSPEKFTVAGRTVLDAFASTDGTAPTANDLARTGATAGNGTVVFVRISEAAATDLGARPAITIAATLKDASAAGNLYAGKAETASVVTGTAFAATGDLDQLAISFDTTAFELSNATLTGYTNANASDVFVTLDGGISYVKVGTTTGGTFVALDKSIVTTKYIAGSTPQYVAVDNVTGSITALSVADGTVSAGPTAVLTNATTITVTVPTGATAKYVVGGAKATYAALAAGTAIANNGTIADTDVTTGQHISFYLVDAAGNVSMITDYVVTEAVAGTMTALTLQ